jgi:DNA-binding transcriptional ArsR family regulator
VDSQAEPRQPPRAVDLRWARAPTVAITACETYDFLLTLHIAFASPERDYVDYAIGRDWIETACAQCAARNPEALRVLGHYFGSLLPSSLHATLLSLVAECPAPRDTSSFLAWLEELDPAELIEVLLDQDALAEGWPTRLAAALTERGAGADERRALGQLVRYFAPEVQPAVVALVSDPETARGELVAALRVWEVAVFAEERPRVLAALASQVAALEKQRAELSPDRFIKLAMHGVEWQRPVGLRRIVLAPSYFCRPAVFYHYWRGTLTFCMPVDAVYLQDEAHPADPRAPSDEILSFFDALGDDTRLRILRLLAEREMYLTELAERLDLTKATTKHHMVKLRTAGLVTLIDRDRLTYYALRPEVHRRAAQLLESYLGRSERQTPAERGGS